MKYIILIGDGMADNPLPHHAGRTPLELAGIPEMNALAAKGVVGRVLTVPQGLPPGSDTAILSICGHDPKACYTGRASLEAAGSGVPLEAGDVAYRCNMVSLEDGDLPYVEKKILSHSGGSVEGHEALELAAALQADAEFAALCQEAGMILYPMASFRHMAVQKGADIAGLEALPPHDHLGEVIDPLLPKGCENAKALNRLMELAHGILNQHPVNQKRRAAGKLPANGIWLWAEGMVTQLDNFGETHGNKRGFVVSAVPLVWGIGALSGLAKITVPTATGELDTDYEAKVQAVLDGLAAGADFALLHIEAPDECTHAGDEAGKLQAIRNIDSRVLPPLLAGLCAMDDFRLLILSDHKTLLATRGHDGDPVPFLLYDSRRDTGSGAVYSEAGAESGPYVEKGHELLRILLETQTL